MGYPAGTSDGSIFAVREAPSLPLRCSIGWGPCDARPLRNGVRAGTALIPLACDGLQAAQAAERKRHGAHHVNALIVILLCLGMSACYSLQTQDWGQWSDRALAEAGTASSATFGWNDWPGMIVSIDQHGEVATGYKSARLRPGRHVIEYSNHVHDFGHVKGTLALDLVASHTYEFRFDTCYWCKPRRFAVWVDDLTTGTVAWGSRPDWPRWYLFESGSKAFRS